MANLSKLNQIIFPHKSAETLKRWCCRLIMWWCYDVYHFPHFNANARKFAVMRYHHHRHGSRLFPRKNTLALRARILAADAGVLWWDANVERGMQHETLLPHPTAWRHNSQLHFPHIFLPVHDILLYVIYCSTKFSATIATRSGWRQKYHTAAWAH